MASQIQAIVKLGGGTISEKKKDVAQPRMEILRRLASEITGANVSCIVIHGGGSYGHPLAKKHILVEGFRYPDQTQSIAETHRAMMALNTIVTDAFTAVGSRALPFSPSSCFTTNEKRIESAFLNPIVSATRFGLLPILYGDVVFDKTLGFTILSGDQIASYLARKLKVRRLIFALEVDGVYTKNPRIQGAKLIKKLTLRELTDLVSKISTETEGSDVTGGMRLKLEESVEAVRAGVTVCFAGVSNPGNIRSAIKGSTFKGTVVEGSPKS